MNRDDLSHSNCSRYQSNSKENLKFLTFVPCKTHPRMLCNSHYGNGVVVPFPIGSLLNPYLQMKIHIYHYSGASELGGQGGRLPTHFLAEAILSLSPCPPTFGQTPIMPTHYSEASEAPAVLSKIPFVNGANTPSP